MRAACGFGLLLCVLYGCGGGTPEEADEIIAPPPTREEIEPEPEAPPLYGPDGELLPSDDVLAGLTLPRGLEEVIAEERRHVYRSPAPYFKVRAYFRERLFTGQVEDRGGGVEWVDAVPTDARGGVVHMDVMVSPGSDDMTRVEIREIAPAPLDAPPLEETLRRLEELQREAE